jgi:chorismate mutase
MTEPRLYAIRGAIGAENDRADIGRRVVELYDACLAGNALAETDVVSCHFTLTRDLDAANPAAMLRLSGRAADVALFTSQEAYIVDGPERILRVLIHAYGPPLEAPRHPYLNGAERLRPDRAGR